MIGEMVLAWIRGCLANRDRGRFWEHQMAFWEFCCRERLDGVRRSTVRPSMVCAVLISESLYNIHKHVRSVRQNDFAVVPFRGSISTGWTLRFATRTRLPACPRASIQACQTTISGRKQLYRSHYKFTNSLSIWLARRPLFIPSYTQKPHHVNPFRLTPLD